MLFQRTAHAVPVGGFHTPGQRHVKAEGFEDVGIAPAVKIAQLDGAERAGVAPCRLGLVRRRPEAVEGDDDLAGKMVEFETASAGKRAKKPSAAR